MHIVPLTRTSRKSKTFKHEGHNGSQRKTLKLLLRVTLCPFCLIFLLFACTGIRPGCKNFTDKILMGKPPTQMSQRLKVCRGEMMHIVPLMGKPPTQKGSTVFVSLSGREDLNLLPLAPHASALAGLRHAPMDRALLYPKTKIWQR